MKKRSSKMDVLVVDDESYICSMVEYALQSLGVNKFYIAWVDPDTGNLFYRPKGCSNIFVIDWVMLEILGLDFLKCIRECNQDVPSVMSTSEYNPDGVAFAAENGVMG